MRTRVKHIDLNIEGVILNEEDFEEYEYTRPNKKWELVLWDNNSRSWIPKKALIML